MKEAWILYTIEQVSHEEGGERMGVTPMMFRKFVNQARKRLGLRAQFSSEELDAKKFAIVADASSHPFEQVSKTAVKEGIDPIAAKTIATRLRQRYPQTLDNLEKVQWDYVERLFGATLTDLLHQIHQEDIEGATLMQKITAAAISVDKMRLLRNEPTSHMVVEDRRQLSELMEVVKDEIERRKLTEDSIETERADGG